MLRLLIGVRLRLAWNRIAHARRRTLRLIGACVAFAFGLGFMGVVGLNSAVLIDRLSRIDQAAPPALLPAILLGGTALSLVTSLSMAFHHLFLSADEELLLAAPVHLRDLFLLKVFETWRDGIHILLFVSAALIGYGAARHQPPQFFAAAIAVAVALTFSGTVVGISLTLLLARIRYGDSLLGVSRLVSIVLFLPVGALGIPAFSVARSRGFTGVSGDSLQTVASTVRAMGPPPEWAPTTWALHVLQADDRMLLSIGLLVSTSAVVVLASLVAFERSFAVGWERVRFAGPRAAGARSAWGSGDGGGLAQRARAPWLTWPSDRVRDGGAVLHMLRKDLRVLVRDPRWRTSLLVSLAALGLPVLFFSASADSSRLSADARFWTGLFPVPYLAYIAHEGSLVELSAAFVVATWLALGGTTAGLVGAALTADFETDNPQRRVGCLGTLLTSGLAALFFATHTALVAWVLLRTLGGIPRPLLGLAPIVDWLVPIAALFALGALVLGAYVGARRLANWEAS